MQREHEALGEHLPGQPARPAPTADANAISRRRPAALREQDVRDVDARDEQHEGRRRRAGAAANCRTGPLQPLFVAESPRRRDCGWSPGYCCCRVAADAVHVGACLLQRDAGLEPSRRPRTDGCSGSAAAGVPSSASGAHRSSALVRKLERRWQHADDLAPACCSASACVRRRTCRVQTGTTTAGGRGSRRAACPRTPLPAGNRGRGWGARAGR